MQTMSWSENTLTLLDQTLLPEKEEYIFCKDWQRVAEAIRRLEVRGAPAIGAAAAFAFVLGAAVAVINCQGDALQCQLQEIGCQLRQTRPTAVNLSWAIARMEKLAASLTQKPGSVLLAALESEAVKIAQEDQQINAQLSSYGASLFHRPITVLTHCNAGALATVGIGTALGVIKQAWAENHIIRVFADETRPLLQGARLTTWELLQAKIPVTLITDNMAGWVMKKKMVQAVIVGADRIAANGDVANKIGTYSVAVLAKEHNIPFYVAAPKSTFDFTISNGSEIIIEERAPSEVRTLGGKTIAPPAVDVFNPAFDVTPAQLVSAIITEHGILRSPYQTAIAAIADK